MQIGQDLLDIDRLVILHILINLVHGRVDEELFKDDPLPAVCAPEEVQVRVRRRAARVVVAELVVAAQAVLHEGQAHAGEVGVHVPPADDVVRVAGEAGGDYFWESVSSEGQRE